MGFLFLQFMYCRIVSAQIFPTGRGTFPCSLTKDKSTLVVDLSLASSENYHIFDRNG